MQPLPSHISANIFDYIRPWKDVEGLNPINIGNLALGR